MRKGIYIALALCAALCSPTMARAEEINYVDSFASGFETLKGEGVNEQVTPERDFEESYVPTLSEVKSVTTEDETDDTVLGHIQSTANAYQRVNIDSSTLTIIGFLTWLFGGYAGPGRVMITAAVGIVFMWWGVRKALRMVMSGFRKGKANV